MKKYLIGAATAVAVVAIGAGSAAATIAFTHSEGHTTVIPAAHSAHAWPHVTKSVPTPPAVSKHHKKHHSSGTHITINQNNGPAVAAPAPPAAPSSWTNCNPGTAFYVMANQNTSCPFAMNVMSAVTSNGYGVSTVYSPTTGQTYSMDAEPTTGPDGGSAVMVTGGNGAAVELYVTTTTGDQPPSMP